MTTIEHELIERISRLDSEKQTKVLEFVRSLKTDAPQKHYSARELMKLPREERNRIAAEALVRSLDNDIEVLEAFNEKDFED